MDGAALLPAPLYAWQNFLICQKIFGWICSFVGTCTVQKFQKRKNCIWYGLMHLLNTQPKY